MSQRIQRKIRAAIAADGKRYRAVMALPEAKGREDNAKALFITALSVDEIRECLAAAPTPSAEYLAAATAPSAKAQTDKCPAAASRPSAKVQSDKCRAAAPKPSANAQSDATLKRIVAGIRARGYGRADT